MLRSWDLHKSSNFELPKWTVPRVILRACRVGTRVGPNTDQNVAVYGINCGLYSVEASLVLIAKKDYYTRWKMPTPTILCTVSNDYTGKIFDLCPILPLSTRAGAYQNTAIYGFFADPYLAHPYLHGHLGLGKLSTADFAKPLAPNHHYDYEPIS